MDDFFVSENSSEVVNNMHLVEEQFEADGMVSIEPTIKFELVRSVLNEYGIVQIGHELCRFTTQMVYVSNNPEFYNELAQGRYPMIPNLKEFPITISEIDLDFSRGNDRVTCTELFGNPRKRTRGVANALNAGYYNEVYLKIKTQRKILGTWWLFNRSSTKVIRGHGYYWYRVYGGAQNIYPFNVDVSQFGGSTLTKVIAYGGNEVRFGWKKVDTYHDSYGDAGCFIDFEL